MTCTYTQKHETFPGMFNRYAPLKGRDWLKRISKEDLAIFVRVGMMNHGYGRVGGIARAKTAKRDKLGRFVRINEN